MAYDTQNLKQNKGGATTERSEAGVLEAGLYRHPLAKDENGKPVEIITIHDPLFGDAQSQGIVRLGFEYVGPAPEGSIQTIIEQNLNSRATAVTQANVGEAQAKADAEELAQLRKEKAERLAAEKAAKKEDKELRKTVDAADTNTQAQTDSGEQAKEQGAASGAAQADQPDSVNKTKQNEEKEGK